MPIVHKVLVIEDDASIRDVLQSFLGEKGFEVTLANNGDQGLEILNSEKFDLVLTDLIMPGKSGLDILREITASKINVPVIVLTGFGSVPTAVEAMRIGAFDYITKPCNFDELLLIIEKALSITKLHKENVMLRMQLKKKYNFKGLIGNSPRMQMVYQLIEKISDADSSILITGETGTGKELIAKTIHYNNISRAGGPFIPLNCGAIPRDLLESELFGHEKGAFTGAINTRMGRFELAQGGTLFLDEVGELDSSLQVKLLRVLQEREFERVGGMKTIKADVRILAASNRDLERATKEGMFRHDLFYRLNVIPLHVPSLRERFEDIELLTVHFIEIFCRKRAREPFVFSPQAMECLLKYPWPGNVRELENLIERLSILLSGNLVDVTDLPEKIQRMMLADMENATVASVASPHSVLTSVSPATGPRNIEFGDNGINLNEKVSTMERDLIMQALGKAGGVRSKAAQLLGLNRTTLLEKMKKMRIELKQ